ncbi:jg10415 [Pararge aegeria aegeria]|uniref:Jg10415 protein n=1 Tax=Pararge aegeria aegeria TaxID=348720 RepID=A0A8S4RF90_9NEOP|nr:jg10415 [Pararge aegeria aegeria]
MSWAAYIQRLTATRLMSSVTWLKVDQLRLPGSAPFQHLETPTSESGSMYAGKMKGDSGAGHEYAAPLSSEARLELEFKL